MPRRAGYESRVFLLCEFGPNQIIQPLRFLQAETLSLCRSGPLELNKISWITLDQFVLIRLLEDLTKLYVSLVEGVLRPTSSGLLTLFPCPCVCRPNHCRGNVTERRIPKEGFDMSYLEFLTIVCERGVKRALVVELARILTHGHIFTAR